MKPPEKPPDSAQTVLPPKIHVVIDPSKIIGVKRKYFIAGLLSAGVSEILIEETLDWAEGLMEIDAKLHMDEAVLRLAARL